MKVLGRKGGKEFLFLWFLHLSVAVSGSYFFAAGTRVCFGLGLAGWCVVSWDDGLGDGKLEMVGIRHRLCVYYCLLHFVATDQMGGMVCKNASKQGG